MIKIARMNQKMVIQKAENQSDEIGNRRTVWKDYFRCSCYAKTYEAQESETGSSGRNSDEQESVFFYVRWCSETKPITSDEYRVVFNGRVYDIVSVNRQNYMNAEIKIHCKLENRQ